MQSLPKAWFQMLAVLFFCNLNEDFKDELSIVCSHTDKVHYTELSSAGVRCVSPMMWRKPGCGTAPAGGSQACQGLLFCFIDRLCSAALCYSVSPSLTVSARRPSLLFNHQLTDFDFWTTNLLVLGGFHMLWGGRCLLLVGVTHAGTQEKLWGVCPVGRAASEWWDVRIIEIIR